MRAVAYPHIHLDPDGTARVHGTRTRVLDLIVAQLAHNWDAPQLQREYPHLSLGQIYSALAYYHDHKPDLDHQLERRLQREADLLAPLESTPLQIKLRAVKGRP